MKNQRQAKSSMPSCIASGSHTRAKVARFVKRAVSKVGRRDWKLDLTYMLDAWQHDAKLDEQDRLDAMDAAEYEAYILANEEECEYEYVYMDQLWDDAQRAQDSGDQEWHDSLMKQYYEHHDTLMAAKKALKERLAELLLPSPSLTSPLIPRRIHEIEFGAYHV
jgi:hypothetical protein